MTQQAGGSARAPQDWTARTSGTSNNSAGYIAVTREVERLIRDDAFKLIAGRADQTARLIVAQLAHRFGFRPDESNGDYRELVEKTRVRYYLETGLWLDAVKGGDDG